MSIVYYSDCHVTCHVTRRVKDMQARNDMNYIKKEISDINEMSTIKQTRE